MPKAQERGRSVSGAVSCRALRVAREQGAVAVGREHPRTKNANHDLAAAVAAPWVEPIDVVELAGRRPIDDEARDSRRFAEEL